MRKENRGRIRLQFDRSGRLVEPKTVASKRDVPIPLYLAHLLAAYKQDAFALGLARPSDFVFPSQTVARSTTETLPGAVSRRHSRTRSCPS